MRILHISKVTGVAGSEGHLLRLLPGLAQNDQDVQIAILEDPRYPIASYQDAMQHQGIKTYKVPIRHHVDWNAYKHLRNLIQAIKPDIVHTHLLHGDLYGLLAARQVRVPIAISTRHNDDKFRRNPLIKVINRRIMENADRVIAISITLASFIVTVEGIPADQVATIHYGLEAPPENAFPSASETAKADLGYQTEDRIIGIFGRLIEQKGIDVLLNAFGLIHTRFPDVKLLIVGEGRDRNTLEDQANKLGLQNVVRFTGWVDNAKRLMPACDIIAVPSRWEGFGLVTLEAMGWGLPIVASRASSLPEIIVDGETGSLVPSENPAALANAINNLLENPDYAKRLGQAGYQRLLTHFSVEHMVCATLDLYHHLTERE